MSYDIHFIHVNFLYVFMFICIVKHRFYIRSYMYIVIYIHLLHHIFFEFPTFRVSTSLHFPFISQRKSLGEDRTTSIDFMTQDYVYPKAGKTETRKEWDFYDGDFQDDGRVRQRDEMLTLPVLREQSLACEGLENHSWTRQVVAQFALIVRLSLPILNLKSGIADVGGMCLMPLSAGLVSTDLSWILIHLASCLNQFYDICKYAENTQKPVMWIQGAF